MYLAVRWSAKYFFCSEFQDILEKLRRRRSRRRKKKAIVKRYAFQALKLSIVILGEEVLLLVMVMLYEVMLLVQSTVLITIIEF